MYKILVVDSDAEAVSTMCNVIESKIPNANVAAVVQNGNDAVRETINIEPDLIVIAIRILGLNGLETIARIRSFNKEVPVIIVSAYDYFEFAKRAMTLGVSDYLLKPLNEQAFQEAVLRELGKTNKEEKQGTGKEKDAKESADCFIEQHFVYSIVCNMSVEEQMGQYRERMGIENYGYILGVMMEPLSLKKQWDAKKVSARIYQRLREIIAEHGAGAVGPKILNRYVVFVSSSGKKSAREEQAQAMELGINIVETLRSTFEMDVKVTIGGVKPLKQIHESYLEMLRSYRYQNECSIVYYKEPRYKNILRETYLELTEQLIESIKYDRYNVGESFLRVLEEFRPLSSEDRMSKLMEVLIAVSYEFRKELKNQPIQYDYMSQSEKLLTMDVKEQEVWACHHLNMMVRLMKSDKNDRKTSVVTEAMEYIQKHYNEDISLNDISNYVNLSPQHFSKIFKEATNFNYVEWINNLRVAKAKEYMNKEDYTIKEVCYLVGYKDPNYFSRIFKKYVGISPTEYVKERAR